METLKVLCVCALLSGGALGHLLPQALEDVHSFVQKQLNQRSQGGQVGVDGPPPAGGPAFHSTYIGTPIIIQNEVTFDANGGVSMPGFPIHRSANVAVAESQNVAQVVAAPPPAPLPTGLIPPVPLSLNAGDQMHQATSASNRHPSVIPVNVVGPSTFVSDAPRNYPAPPANNSPAPRPYQPQQQHQRDVPQQIGSGDKKTMEGWVPLDDQGSRLAKGVGVKLQVDDDLRAASAAVNSPSERQPDYQGTAYSIRAQGGDSKEGREIHNELEVIPTNSIKLGATPEEDIIVGGPKQEGERKYPVYQGRDGRGTTPKVVIHAQNVIIRGGPDGTVDEINANNDSIVVPGVHPAVKQFAAYQSVPQLNSFLRDQLRFAAMNQLLESAMHGHPLSDKPFPRPLSLREIAQAVRNGEFPQPSREQLSGGGLIDPLASQSSVLRPTQLQVNIPHMVRMRPGMRRPVDPLTGSSIQSQQKVFYPGAGLASLYKNMLGQQGGGNGFDPRDPLEYSLLAALSGGRHKAPHTSAHKPGFTADYGDNVKYTTGDDGKAKDPSDKEPVQVVDTSPSVGDLVNPQQDALGNTGNLKDVSEQVLKQLLLQELKEVEQEQGQGRPQLLLPAGLGPNKYNLQSSFRNYARPAYGQNTHPFGFLATETEGANPGVFEETFEYTLPPGTGIDDYLNYDGHSAGLKSRPAGPSSQYTYQSSSGGSNDDLMPLNRDTLVQLGKSALSSALEFSRHHNPLTLLSRIRSLPPVKVEMYKVPMGIPDGLMEKLPESWKAGVGGSAQQHHHGPPPGYQRRGRRKHLPRKSNKYL